MCVKKPEYFDVFRWGKTGVIILEKPMLLPEKKQILTIKINAHKKINQCTQWKYVCTYNIIYK